MREPKHAALVEQDFVVELFGERLPEPKREVVDRRALVPEVVRANDRRVPDRVPGPQPAPLDDRDVGQAVVLRQVVRRREPVQPAADDDGVVGRLRVGVAPEEVGMAFGGHAANMGRGGGGVKGRAGDDRFTRSDESYTRRRGVCRDGRTCAPEAVVMTCPECQSDTLAGGKSGLVHLRKGVPVVVRNVPGFACHQCGYFDFAGDTAKSIDALLDAGTTTGSITAAVIDLEQLPAARERRKPVGAN